MLKLTGIRNRQLIVGEGSYCPTFPFCRVDLTASFSVLSIHLKKKWGWKCPMSKGKAPSINCSCCRVFRPPSISHFWHPVKVPLRQRGSFGPLKHP